MTGMGFERKSPDRFSGYTPEIRVPSIAGFSSANRNHVAVILDLDHSVAWAE
jgi:hypothetical protein